MPLFCVLLIGSLFAGDIGIEVTDRPAAFVDLAKRARPFTRFDGATRAPIDGNGWPASDGQVVLFDLRPIRAWSPPADDPALFQPDMSGVYQIRFHGQAAVTNG